MRVKTSITLPDHLICRPDQVDANRSAVPERAARAYLAKFDAEQRASRDLEIINRNAGRLNREAADILDYQKLP